MRCLEGDFSTDKVAFENVKDILIDTLEESTRDNDGFVSLINRLSYSELDALAETISTALWIAYTSARIELRKGLSKL